MNEIIHSEYQAGKSSASVGARTKIPSKTLSVLGAFSFLSRKISFFPFLDTNSFLFCRMLFAET